MSQQINLFNPSLLKRKDYFSALNLLVLLALSLLIVVLGFVYTRAQVNTAKMNSEQAANKLTTLTNQVNALREAHAARLKNPALAQELAAIESSLLRRHQIAQILQNSQFGNTDGYSSYLSAFARQIPQNLWITGFTLEGAGYDLILNGRTLQAELVPLYVTQLKREPIMQGKTFSTLQMERPMLAVPAAVSAADPKKLPEPAPYLEFQLHSTGMAEKADKEKTAGAKTP